MTYNFPIWIRALDLLGQVTDNFPTWIRALDLLRQMTDIFLAYVFIMDLTICIVLKLNGLANYILIRIEYFFEFSVPSIFEKYTDV